MMRVNDLSGEQDDMKGNSSAEDPRVYLVTLAANLGGGETRGATVECADLSEDVRAAAKRILDLSDSEQRRRIAVELLDAEAASVRFFTACLLWSPLLFHDVETNILILSEHLIAHPEDTADVAWIVARNFQGKETIEDPRILRALLANCHQHGRGLDVVARISPGRVPVEILSQAVHYLMQCLRDSDLPAREHERLWKDLDRLLSPGIGSLWDRSLDQIGGPLADVVNDPEIPFADRARALGLWLARRSGVDWSPIDAALDPKLYAYALISRETGGVFAYPNLPETARALRTDVLLYLADLLGDAQISTRDRESAAMVLCESLKQDTPQTSTRSDLERQRLVERLFSALADLALNFSVYDHLCGAIDAYRERFGVPAPDHPGEQAPLAVLSTAISFGTTPRPDDVLRMSERLGTYLTELKGARKTLLRDLPPQERTLCRALLRALRWSYRRSCNLSKKRNPSLRLCYFVRDTYPETLVELEVLLHQLPYFIQFSAATLDERVRMATNPEIPRPIRVTFYDAVDDPDFKAAIEVEGLKSADLAEKIVRRAIQEKRVAALLATIANHPDSRHQHAIMALPSQVFEVAGALPALLRLREAAEGAGLEFLADTIERGILDWAWQIHFGGNLKGAASLGKIPSDILDLLIADPDARANPLVALQTLLAKGAPAPTPEWLLKVLSDPELDFFIAGTLRRAIVDALPRDVLVRLLSRENPRASNSQNVPELQRLIFTRDPELALLILRFRVPATGTLADADVVKQLLAIARLAHEPEDLERCRELLKAYRKDTAWPALVRDALTDPSIPSSLLIACTSISDLAKAWQLALPTTQRNALFVQRVSEGILRNPDGQPLSDAVRTVARELSVVPELPDSLRAKLQALLEARKREEPVEDAKPDLTQCTLGELVDIVRAPSAPLGRRIAALWVLRQNHFSLDAANEIWLSFATADLPGTLHCEVMAALEKFPHLVRIAELLDARIRPEARLKRAKEILHMLRAGNSRLSHLELLFDRLFLRRSEEWSVVATAGLRPILLALGIKDPSVPEKDLRSPLTEVELAGIERWLAFFRSQKLQQLWDLGKRVSFSPEETTMAIAAVLVAKVSDSPASPDPEHIFDFLQQLDLSPEALAAAIRALSEYGSCFQSGKCVEKIIAIGWGAGAQPVVTEAAGKFVSACIRKGHAIPCETIASDPRLDVETRVLALERTEDRYSDAQLRPLHNLGGLLLHPTTTSALRARILNSLRRSCRAALLNANERKSLLAYAMDRSQIAEIRLNAIRLLGRRLGHFEATDDADARDIQETLVQILGNTQLAHPMRAAAFHALLDRENVSGRSSLCNTLTSEIPTEPVIWLLRQLRDANRVPNRQHRDIIRSHEYRHALGELHARAAELPRVPSGLQLLLADFSGRFPQLARMVNRAFAVRRGAVATAEALGVWIDFLDAISYNEPFARLLENLATIDPDGDATLLAQRIEFWLRLSQGEKVVAFLKNRGATVASFQELVDDLDQLVIGETAQVLLQHLPPESEHSEPVVYDALRKVTRGTPAPIVLSGHYQRGFSQGLDLLGRAVCAAAAGAEAWTAFKYDRDANTTLNRLPQSAVAEWREPLQLTVSQVIPSPAFEDSCRSLREAGHRCALHLRDFLRDEWNSHFSRLSGAVEHEAQVAAGIAELERSAAVFGQQATDRSITPDAARMLQRRARGLRALATLTRFAFLDASALAANELRAVGEPQGYRGNRTISIQRAWSGLAHVLPDLLGEGGAAARSALEECLARLPEFPERRDLIVEERDDFATLIEIGARPYGSGSCQNFWSANGMNRALMAYVADGDKRVIVAREAVAIPDGCPPDLRARAIFRLGIDADRRPVLLLEPIYATGGRSDQLRAEIEQLARNKAECLQAVLLCRSAQGPEVTAHFAPSRNGVQYEDSGAGLIHEGKGYTLKLPCLADFRSSRDLTVSHLRDSSAASRR